MRLGMPLAFIGCRTIGRTPVSVTVFTFTINNISVISWLSGIYFFLVEEIEVPGENHRPATSHWQKNVVSSTSRHEWDCDLTTLVVINTDCSGLSKWRNVIFYEL